MRTIVDDNTHICRIVNEELIAIHGCFPACSQLLQPRAQLYKLYRKCTSIAGHI